MKKLYLLFTVLITTISLAQEPIITAIVDGDCTNNPRMLEIYASGVVDFSLYSLQNQTFSSTTWGNTQALTNLGIVTDAFVYITNNSDFTIFNAEFPSLTSPNTLISFVSNLNGDDRIRIIETSTTTVIDQYGVGGIDGSGKSWEYTDSYAKRNNGTGPDGGFVEANWTIPGKNTLLNEGTCNGGSTIESIMGGIGTFSLSTAAVSRNEIPNFSIYPNPVINGILTINSVSNEDKNIEIYDILGKKQMSTTINGRELNISKLNPGIYILKAQIEGKMATRKLVIK